MKLTIIPILLLLINLQLFSQADSSYFPLQIGNQMEYYNGYKYSFGEIKKDTLYKNGKRYFELPFSISELHFARRDSIGNVYSIESMFNPFQYDSVESFVFNNNAQLNESWIVSKSGPPRYATLWGKYVYSGTQFIFNKQRKIKGIVIHSEAIELVRYYFAEGIGVVRTEYDDGTIVLINYAKINNNVYGKILNVTEKEILPSKFEVSQNFPNPFNSTTSIDIQIPSSINGPNEIELTIYDMLGNMLFRNKYPAKIDQLKFRINLDLSALRLSSGTYYYTVRSKEYMTTMKMIYLK